MTQNYLKAVVYYQVVVHYQVVVYYQVIGPNAVVYYGGSILLVHMGKNNGHIPFYWPSTTMNFY